MPKTAKKKTTPKKTVAKKRPAQSQKAAVSNAGSPPGPGPIIHQPQSKQAAAVQAGIFLQTNDAWSEVYFDPSDLHFLERELFG